MIYDTQSNRVFDSQGVFQYEQSLRDKHGDCDGRKDWAVVRLDRSVPDSVASPVRVASTEVAIGTPFMSIGHPDGLPRKYAGDAQVKEVMQSGTDAFPPPACGEGAGGVGTPPLACGEASGGGRTPPLACGVSRSAPPPPGSDVRLLIPGLTTVSANEHGPSGAVPAADECPPEDVTALELLRFTLPVLTAALSAEIMSVVDTTVVGTLGPATMLSDSISL